MSNVLLRPLRTEDAPACDAIIASLPYFFGDPDGVRDCAAAVRSQSGVIADLDGVPAGFLTLLPHNRDTAEITWMAVDAHHRRHGIGRQLIDAAVDEARADGRSLLCVLTLGPSVPEEPGDNYEGTRAFYQANGFVPLRELGLRDWNDASALLLARPLGVGATGRPPEPSTTQDVPQRNALVPELYVSDFAASLQFYTATLGFTVQYARPEERFAFLERDGAQIMIEQPIDPARTWLAAELTHPYGRGINLQIATSDVSTMHKTVLAAGCQILVPLEDRVYEVGGVPMTCRQFVVLDPDGYLLRFSEDSVS